MFYNNGLVGSDTHCSIAYGNYPPGLQLFEWWILHLAGGWKENLLFIGRALFNFSFLFPVLKVVDKPGKRAYAPILVWLLYIFPAFIGITFYDRLGTDASLGVVFGGLLVAVWDTEQENWFYFLRIFLYAAVLVLVKSTGIIWLLFSVPFLLYTNYKKMESKNRMKAVGGLLCGGCVWVTWLAFCRAEGLSNYLEAQSATSIKDVFLGNWAVPEIWKTFFKEYLVSIFFKPLNDTAFGVTGFLLLLIVLAFIWMLQKCSTLERAQAKKLIVYFIGISFLWNVFVLGSVFFTFWGEFGGLQGASLSRTMFLVVTRYGAPLYFGVTFFVLNLLPQYQITTPINVKYRPAYLLCAAIILLAFTGIYRKVAFSVKTRVIENDAMIESIEQIPDRQKERMMIWTSDGNIVSKQYELVPLSSYGFVPENYSYSEEEQYRDALIYEIENMGYTLIWYKDETDTPFKQVAQKMLRDQGQQFEAGGVYSICADGGSYYFERLF